MKIISSLITGIMYSIVLLLLLALVGGTILLLGPLFIDVYNSELLADYPPALRILVLSGVALYGIELAKK
jgi:hypothetical protein